jgi:hypothetical protein
MAATAGKLGKVSVVGTGVAFTDEATTTSDNKTYQITNAAKQIWSRFGTILVEDSAIPTVEAYTVNRLNGSVTFGTAVARVITITGTYLPITTLAYAKEYSFTISGDNQDITVFMGAWIDRIQGLKDFSASCGKFYEITNYFWGKLTADTDLCLEFYHDNAADPDIRAWVKIAGDDFSNSVDGVSEESVDFEGTLDADKRCVSTGPF